ncbi:NAD-dependent epimerase/dehydratase family protein [Halobacterium wangiae]|uniref:NAD-dependent epimerase/dehydratase family protein n=1 Tax=Halobacterium wangiae TaxID=2902623 RepID=UPI001E32F50C|nr:NAD-dependent epimerase/dehydratase family protein [Halobacterium wangiae]
MSEEVLVTGGTGFIGSHLAAELAATGRNVTVLSRDTPDRECGPDSTKKIQGDVRTLDEIPSFRRYDTVFHLAGVVSVQGSIEDPQQTFQVNTVGTQNVLERARRDNVDEVVYLSSASVYGKPEDLPISENHPIQPTHPYAATKAAGEDLVNGYAAAYDIGTKIVRAFTVYGPGQSSDNLVPMIIKQAESGGPVELGNTDPTRDFVHVQDLVRGIETLVESDGSSDGVYNIGSGQESSVMDVVDAVLDALDKPDIDVNSDAGGRSSDVEIERMVSDNSRIEALGWSPKFDLQNGITHTIKSSRI